ncbi:MAG: hypothetical protein WCK14_01020 [Actinomycetota bacterium]
MDNTTAIDATSLVLYEHLARRMNHREEHFRTLGEADMTVAIVVKAPDYNFTVQLVFEELRCAGVDVVTSDEAKLADFQLVGDLASWNAMFDNIVFNGAALGDFTINSLALRGNRISCESADPMGLDKFSRFNQTLQDFLDGAAHLDLTRSTT